MKKQITTIRGIVVPAAWRPGGLVAAVDVAGYDESRYRVVDDPMGKQLLGLLKKRVIADGVLQTIDNRPTILVQRFRIDPSDPMRTGDDLG